MPPVPQYSRRGAAATDHALNEHEDMAAGKQATGVRTMESSRSLLVEQIIKGRPAFCRQVTQVQADARKRTTQTRRSSRFPIVFVSSYFGGPNELMTGRVLLPETLFAVISVLQRGESILPAGGKA